MSSKLNRHPNRHVWRCSHELYHNPELRDRSCARVNLPDRTAGGSAVAQCGRDRLRPELPLATAERFLTAPHWILRANG